MDRLSQKGRHFQRAYCQIPICSPSRASVMSGRRPDTIGLYGNRKPVREHIWNAVPLQEHFSANGYFTARVGKIYHTRHEHEFAWDVTEDFYESEDGSREDSNFVYGSTQQEDGETPDGRTARRVAELLEKHRHEKFFIAAGFVAPHVPLLAPQKYYDMYALNELTLDEGPEGDRDDIPRTALSPGSNLRFGPGEERSVLRAYYACVSLMDAQLGVVLDAMDRLELWRNTVVVLWSDNGFHLGEHRGLWRKNTLFEESTRVPLIIFAPGIERPGIPTRNIVELVDIYPTLVELGRLPMVDGLEGTSLVPLLRGTGEPVKTAAFTVAKRLDNLGRTVRTERYRYTEWPNGSRELYDHQDDPEETLNIADSPTHREALREMRQLLHDGYLSALAPR
jgi:uncharacterized sulfatase